MWLTESAWTTNSLFQSTDSFPYGINITAQFIPCNACIDVFITLLFDNLLLLFSPPISSCLSPSPISEI